MRVGLQGPTAPPVAMNRVLAKLAERAGFDSYWALDHMMGVMPPGMWTPEYVGAARVVRDAEPHFDPFPLVAAIAAKTRRIRLGFAVADTIRLHPAWLARAALTLQHVSKGRFILGLGAGERENLEPYGWPADRLAGRCREALEVIRALWSTKGPVDHDGEFFHLRGAQLALRPYLKRPPPIWLAAMGPRMLETTARYADGWLPHDVTPERWRAALATIREAARSAGRDPDTITPGLFLTAFIDTTHDAAHAAMAEPSVRVGALEVPAQAWRDAGATHPLGENHRGIVDYVPTRYTAEEMRAIIEKIPWDAVHNLFPHGEPAEIVEHVRPFRDAGLRDVVIQNVSPVSKPSRALASGAAFTRTARLLKKL